MTGPLNGREAVTAFAAWLSTRREAIVVGDDREPANLHALVLAFCDAHGLPEIRPGWEVALRLPREPSDDDVALQALVVAPRGEA